MESSANCVSTLLVSRHLNRSNAASGVQLRAEQSCNQLPTRRGNNPNRQPLATQTAGTCVLTELFTVTHKGGALCCQQKPYLAACAAGSLIESNSRSNTNTELAGISGLGLCAP